MTSLFFSYFCRYRALARIDSLSAKLPQLLAIFKGERINSSSGEEWVVWWSTVGQRLHFHHQHHRRSSNVRLVVAARFILQQSCILLYFVCSMLAACLCSFVRRAFAFGYVRFAVASSKQHGSVIVVHNTATKQSGGGFVLLDIARSFGLLSCLLLVF